MKPISISDPGLFLQKDECFISPCDRLGVVVIRKSLSTFMKKICRENGFRSSTVDQNQKRKYLVVLRDPLDRWYASVHWYIRNHGLDKKDIHPSLIDFMVNNICWDDHTLPQYCYLTGIPRLSQIKAVDFSSGVFEKISQVMKSFGYACHEPNETSFRQGHPFDIQQFNNDQTINRIQNFYNQDYWMRHWLLDKTVPDKIMALREDL